jgi:predicted permease
MTGPRRAFRLPWRTRAQIRADLDAELEFHYRMRTEELMTQGMSEADARREAEREFGDEAYTRRYCEELDRASERQIRLRDAVRDLAHDLHIALRGLVHRPAYAIVVILSLALGVGANTAVFSVLDSVLLRRLPFPHPERLVTVDELNLRANRERSDIAPAEYLAWVRAQTRFEGIALHSFRNMTLTGGAAPEMLTGSRVSANFFDVLGVHAAFGRTFRPGEDATLDRIVVLADGAWRRLFGADSSIVGRQILLGGNSYTVIGVLPPEFVFPGRSNVQFFEPIDFAAGMADPNRAWKFHRYHGFARLGPGVSLADARAELTTIARRIERERPETNTGHLTTVLPLDDALVGNARTTILALMGAAVFVLLIAAANLANLALSRALGRRPEFAVRAALGASRWRLVRLALTESLALSVIGGAVGLGVAYVGTPLLLRLYPSALPPSFTVGFSVSALVFALGAAIATGVAFGLVPAFAATRAQLTGTLRDGTHGSSAGRTRSRARDALVVMQVALAMVLVVGAGLLIQTLLRLQSLDLGYQPRNVSTVWLSLSGPRYDTREAIVAFWDALRRRLAEEPRIQSIGLAGAVPFAGGSGASLAIDGRPNEEPLPEVRYTVYSPGFRTTIGVPLLAGRDFNDLDRAGGQDVVLINEAAAKRFWLAQSPIGARIRLGPDPSEPWATVVGVIGDFRQEGLESAPRPLAIQNARQDVWSSMFVAMRSRESPVALDAIVKKAVRELDPAIAVGDATSLESLLGGELAPRRFAVSILGVFGAIALLLAVVGVYGVIAYGVAARRRELGVRVALGAVPRQLAASVLAQGIWLGITGLVIGTASAVMLTRFLANLLFGVGRLDAPTFAAAAVILGAATLIACWIPARRAAHADPMTVLREE